MAGARIEEPEAAKEGAACFGPRIREEPFPKGKTKTTWGRMKRTPLRELRVKLVDV